MELCPQTHDGRHVRSFQADEEGTRLVCIACGRKLPLANIMTSTDIRDNPVIETRDG